MKNFVFISFLAAFLIRIGYVITIQHLHPNSIFLYDSGGYINLAFNMFNKGVYSQMNIPPFTPDSTRSPLYPSFLYIFVALKATGVWVVWVQAVIGALTAAISSKCAYLIKPNKLAALIIGLIISIDLPSIFFTNTLLTETLFSFFLICAFFFFIERKKKYSSIYTLFFLVLATYTKPIAIYLIFLLPIGILFIKNNSLKNRFLHSFKLFTIGLLFLSPWLYRNQQIFGNLSFSSIAEINLLFHTSSNIKAITNNTTRKIEEYKYRNSKPLSQLSFNTDTKAMPTFQKYARKEFFNTIKNHPLTTSKMLFKSWIGFFIKPIRSYYSLQIFGKNLNQITSISSADKNTSYLNHFRTAITKENGIIKALIIFQIFMLALIYLSILFSIPFWINKQTMVGITLIILISFFSIISSITDVDARFRVPVVSFLVLLSYPAWCKILEKI